MVPVERELMLQAQYLPGMENLKADRLLLVMRNRSDWMLGPVNPEVIHSLGDQSNCIQPILLAPSPLQLDNSPLITNDLVTNDLVRDWQGLKAYANPL